MKYAHRLIASLLCFAMLIPFVSCTNSGSGTPTEAPSEAPSAPDDAPVTDAPTEPETDAPTEAPTEPETEPETEAETTRFNENKVDYRRDTAVIDGEEKDIIIAEPCEGYELGLDITDKKDVVGICYTMWFNAILGNGDAPITSVLNVAELQAKYGFSAEYGFGDASSQHNKGTQFHFWSEPAQGYYRSTDKQACRNNLEMIYKAGVDFLILDYTFCGQGYLPGTGAWNTYVYGPMMTLLDTIMEMRAEGQGTPYVVMWFTSKLMYEPAWKYFYGNELYKDCFVYWDDKPFLLMWDLDSTDLTSAAAQQYTIRAMYGLQGRVKTNQWSYLEHDTTQTISYDADGNAEQVCVCVAAQHDYMSQPSAQGREGGTFFYSEWLTAFRVHPKIVTVTWWNEWCAQLYKIDGVGWIFTDNFNQEYSRDIEPMKGGHGDQYYQWLCEYVRAYRSGEECPRLYEPDYEKVAERLRKLNDRAFRNK
ncbi:MAG: hypothetical protein MJ192_11515 [Clostridia bacterium]|nr:hypothetical protein [Clostridia bacterium]